MIYCKNNGRGVVLIQGAGHDCTKKIYDELEKKIQDNPELYSQVIDFFGKWHLGLILNTNDYSELNAIAREEIRSIPGVREAAAMDPEGFDLNAYLDRILANPDAPSVRRYWEHRE